MAHVAVPAGIIAVTFWLAGVARLKVLFTYLPPLALLLLMLSIDDRSVLRLGPAALGMVVAGAVGILIGGTAGS